MEATSRPAVSRWLVLLVFLGGYLSLRGYESRDGDQAYRLPLLLHQQDPRLFAGDPFVRAFDTFNPHRGYLALLDMASRPLGLSAGLFGLFALTFAGTGLAIERLGRACWPEAPREVGWVAFALLLAADAGNIGTNHLFEPVLLDRLIVLALGWTAMAGYVAEPSRGIVPMAMALGAGAIIHPSLGLQLALLMISGLVLGALLGPRAGLSPVRAVGGIAVMLGALVPAVWLIGGQSSRLMEGLPTEEFRLLALFVQGPQHLVPSLWRLPQWLAWACYPSLALLSSVRGSWRMPPARQRLLVLLGVALSGLGVAACLVEVPGLERLAVFQPFRTATIVRGLCLVLIADRVLGLWRRGDLPGRLRAGLLFAGLLGDWTMVVATLVELATTAADLSRHRAAAVVVLAGSLALGVTFLVRHDPEWGWAPVGSCLLIVMGASLVARVQSGSGRPLTTGRLARLAALSWAIPALALLVALSGGGESGRLCRSLVAHCRFGETPIDDVERLAAWCREHTPVDARFVGPPGPKTFRLWSRRDVAFNRAASPYHAAGLADWSARFRDHVGFPGTTAEFAQAYLADRQRLERGFSRLDAPGLSQLARRQGASYVLAAANLDPGPVLEPLRREGRYGVYRVASGTDSGRPPIGPAIANLRQPGGGPR
jgi:hypothetical protein